jgi:hypothetical protein
MYAISRYLQTVASKKRARHKQSRELERLRDRARKSEREVRRLQRRSRRLDKLESSRWWRLRPRLSRLRRVRH